MAGAIAASFRLDRQTVITAQACLPPLNQKLDTASIISILKSADIRN
jgi:hypothetical protein